MTQRRLTFGKQLAAWREAYKLPQRELAEELGTDVGTISKWENDLHRPGPSMQKIIEDYYQWQPGTIRRAIRENGDWPKLPEPKVPSSSAPRQAAAAGAGGGEQETVPAALLTELLRQIESVSARQLTAETLNADLQRQIRELGQRISALEDPRPASRRRRG